MRRPLVHLLLHLLHLLHLLVTQDPSKDQNKDVGSNQTDLPPTFFDDFFNYLNGTILWRMSGTSGKMTCVPDKFNTKIISEAEYKWSNSSGEVIDPADYSGWRMLSDGTMQVDNFEIDRSGAYRCDLVSRRNADDVLNYTHNLMVYGYPNYTLKYVLYFSTHRCDDKKEYKEYVTDVLRMFCEGQKTCSYEFKYHGCTSSSQDTSKSKFEILKEFSQGKGNQLILKFVVRIFPDPNYKPPVCDVACVSANMKQSLSTMSSAKMERLHQMNRDVYKDSFALTYLGKMTETVLESNCNPGFEQYKRLLCVPCMPGTGKAGDGEEKCEPCGHFAYQDVFMATGCIKCPFFKLTAKAGARLATDCDWLYYNAVFWVLVILSVVLMIVPGGLAAFAFWRIKNDEGWIHKMIDSKLAYNSFFYEPSRRKMRTFDYDEPELMQPLLSAPVSSKKKDKDKKAADEGKSKIGADPELEKQMENKAKHILKLQQKIEKNTDAIDQMKGGPKKMLKMPEAKEDDVSKRVINQLLNPVKKKKKKKDSDSSGSSATPPPKSGGKAGPKGKGSKKKASPSPKGEGKGKDKDKGKGKGKGKGKDKDEEKDKGATPAAAAAPGVLPGVPGVPPGVPGVPPGVPGVPPGYLPPMYRPMFPSPMYPPMYPPMFPPGVAPTGPTGEPLRGKPVRKTGKDLNVPDSLDSFG